MDDTLPAIALIPAKGASRRVADKNTRPFCGGRSLVEWKIAAIQASGVFSAILVSSESENTLQIASDAGAVPLPRPPQLSADGCAIGEVIKGVAEQCLQHTGYADAFLYWAHPTAPFVRPETIKAALSEARCYPETCIVGVERLHEFLWTPDGPLNYDPDNQPRSQDLPPLFRIAGGIHLGRAQRMIHHRSHTFTPRLFIEMSRAEALDINVPEDWDFCASIAPLLMLGNNLQ